MAVALSLPVAARLHSEEEAAPISAERLRSHAEVLGSDAFEGRGLPDFFDGELPTIYSSHEA